MKKLLCGLMALACVRLAACRAQAATQTCATKDLAGNCIPGQVLIDPNSGLPYAATGGGGGGGSLSAKANASTQTSSEGATTDPLSMDLTRHLRVIDDAVTGRLDTMITALSDTSPSAVKIDHTTPGTTDAVVVSGAADSPCDVVSGDQAYTVGTSHRCTLTATGRLKVGLSSNATIGSTAATTADLAGAVDPSGNQRANQQDANGNLQVANRASKAFSGVCPAGQGTCDSNTPLTGSGGGTPSYTGVVRDSGAAPGTQVHYSYFNAAFYTDQPATVSILCSNDGTNFVTCASTSLVAGNMVIMTVPYMFRYYRTFIQNTSVTAETTLWVNSSFTGA